jgi:predicted enzyme related to lactoylglutathione lyase
VAPMPERHSYKPGTPSWVELGTSDIDGAAAFYGDLFGWDVADPQPEAGGYRIAELGGKAVAGLSPLMQEGQPVAWSTYVATDDADGVAERVRSSGGQVLVEPMDVMELGRFAVFMDPTGAAIGVWQAKQFAGAQLVNEPGALTWNELLTRDIGAAQAFYPAVLGWGVEERDFGGAKYTIWQVDGEMVAGGMPMSDQFPSEIPSHWALYFAVDDTDATVEKARQLGAQVRMEPTDIPDVGRFALLADPQGASFSVIKNAQQAS